MGREGADAGEARPLAVAQEAPHAGNSGKIMRASAPIRSAGSCRADHADFRSQPSASARAMRSDAQCDRTWQRRLRSCCFLRPPSRNVPAHLCFGFRPDTPAVAEIANEIFVANSVNAKPAFGQFVSCDERLNILEQVRHEQLNGGNSPRRQVPLGEIS